MNLSEVINVIDLEKLGNRMALHLGRLNVGIFSRQCVENVEFLKEVAVISIRTAPQEGIHKATINPKNVAEVLYLWFDDIDTIKMTRSAFSPISSDEVERGNLFRSEQAQQVLSFAERNKDKIIICQCEAGISRSSAVAAALSLIYNGTDKEIFNSPRYRPNMFVYKTILNEYFQS